MVLKVLYIVYIVVVAVPLSLAMPILYFIGIYRKKYVVEAELVSWDKDICADSITGNIQISNLSAPTLSVSGIYIIPSFSSSSFTKKKYIGSINSDNDVLKLSMMDKKIVSVTFPVDVSSLYESDDSDPRFKKTWTLVLKTNLLPRHFKISAPVQ